MGSKCRVITAAMFHMENQSHIQYMRLHLCILHIRPEHTQEILCCRQLWIRTMNIHAFITLIVIVRMVAVNRQHRHGANQHHTLAKHIFN